MERARAIRYRLLSIVGERLPQRVDSPRREGMALCKTLEGEPAALEHTVALNRLAGILGAGRMETARRRKEGRDIPLVHGQRGAHHLSGRGQFRFSTKPRRRSAVFSSRASASSVTRCIPSRGLMTKSPEGSSRFVERNHSLKRRLARLRSTAGPIFRVAVIPNRGRSSPFSRWKRMKLLQTIFRPFL